MLGPDRHVLPAVFQDGWVTLSGRDANFCDDDRPFALTIGRLGGSIALLTRAELAALRDAATAALRGPHRVLVPNPDEQWDDIPNLGCLIRDRLNTIRKWNMLVEVGVLLEHTDSVASHWAADYGVPLLVFDTLDDMFAAGGSEVIIVAGAHALDIGRRCSDARMGRTLLRPGAREGS